jgi:hypothetical protein
MPMQISVLADSRLNSIPEWQEAIDDEGFSLQLSDADPNRNLAARLPDEETSIEYGTYDFRELKEAYSRVSIGHDWRYAITFTWSSDFAEEIAAWMAATAYARATNGVIFYQQEGKIFTPEESRRIARHIEQRRPMLEAMFQNYIERLLAESPEAEEKLREFMRRSSKSDHD